MFTALLGAVLAASACAGPVGDDDPRLGYFGPRDAGAAPREPISPSGAGAQDASSDTARPSPPEDAGDAGDQRDSAAAATPGTWSSGASGVSVSNGQFAAWRGASTRIAGTWNDRSWESSEAQGSLSGEYAEWSGDIDDTMGAFWSGSWADAAAGAYDAHWRKAVSSIAAARARAPGTLYLRFAHEMNGTWFQWSVTSNNVAAFKTAWARFAKMVRSEMPSAKIVFSANNGTGSDIGVPEMWPGDEYVDVVSVDMSDSWPNLPDEVTWDAEYVRVDHTSSPRGLGKWLEFAKAHGKPLAVSQWGINWASDGTSGPQDNPFFIKKMNEFFRVHAGTGPGQVLYEIYYNMNDAKGQLYPIDANPNASAKYKSLSWGE